MSRGFPGQEGPSDLDGTKKPIEQIQDQGGCEEWPWEGAGQPGVGGLLQGPQPGWPLPLGGSSRLQ